ncbi:reverse transcriptase domain-containing protein [Tanacetum coccineum]|uniref:Reverse transcriptase domain-containing protein n=1 Tax=Tanacetum coccineum TaxID=301880 RepID=A0ABQ5A2M9_9ASTR
MIRAVRINVPLVDVLAGMPNYGKFLKELISNKHKIEQNSAAFLSDESLAMIQNKVLPKLGDPRSFLIKYFDALLDEGSKILHSIERTLLEEEIFAEFDEFIAMTADENYDSESDTEDPPFEKITINSDCKIKTSLEEPPTDLELNPLPDNLEYVFLEEPSFLSVIISSQLSKENKNKLVSVLKKHKEAFAWKTIDIPGICPSFCKHKIQLLDDKKPVVQKQRRLNPNMQEVIKKEIVKLLDTDFSKIARPIIKLLESDTPFEFDDECLKAFELLKEKLTCAPVIVSPNWNLPFKLMCDAIDFVVGVVLGQKDEFDIEIKDRKGTKNVSTDHLSRIENDKSSDDSDVDDNFSRETLMEINTKYEPYVELYGKDGKTFIVNGHRLKLYHEEDNDPMEAVTPFFLKE